MAAHPVDSLLLEAGAAELETLREVLRRAPFGVIVYDPVNGGEDFRFVFTNPALEATKAFQTMLGSTYGETWPELADMALPKFREVLRTGEPWVERAIPLEVEVMPGKMDTRLYTYEVGRAFVSGRPLLFAFVNDVTREQQTMDALRDARAEAQRELEISSALLQAASELARLTDMSDMANSIAQILLGALGHSRVSVFLIDESRRESRALASRGAQPLPEGTTFPFSDVSASLESAIRAGQVTVFDFETLPPNARGPATDSGSTVVLLAPIRQAGSVLGVVVVDDPGERKDFTDRDITFAGGMASQAAVAIQNTRSLETQRERSIRWRVLAEVAEITSSALDPSHVIDGALSIAEEHLGVLATSLWTFSDDGSRLVLIAARGFPSAFAREFSDGVPVGAAFPIAEAVRLGRPVLFEHVDDGDELYTSVRDAYARYGIPLRSLAAVPLVTHGAVTGVMTLAWDRERTFDDAYAAFLITLAERFAMSLENARLFSEQASHAQYAEALNRVHDAIHSTLSAAEVMQAIADEMTRALDADVAMVQLRREGHRELVYSRGVSKTLPSRLTDERSPLSALIERTGAPLAIEDIAADSRASGTILLELGLRSVLGLPLQVRDEVIGIIFVGRRGAPQPFSDRDFNFAKQVAATASVAVQNASLYETQQRVADRLQEALLSLPDAVEGLEFAHAYHSATAAARVGGDFYDVFPIGHDLAGIVIGDVAGKGLEAAVLTSVVRNLIRSNAGEGNDPAEVLRLVNDVLFKATVPESFVTLLFAVLDCRDGTLRYSNAGHTTPVIRTREGTLLRLGPNGGILGAFAEPAIGRDVARLGEGDVLLLYTDGIIEARRGDELYGEERVYGVIAGLEGSDPEAVVKAIMTSVLDFTGGELSDDVAVLALRPSGADDRRAARKQRPSERVER